MSTVTTSDQNPPKSLSLPRRSKRSGQANMDEAGSALATSDVAQGPEADTSTEPLEIISSQTSSGDSAYCSSIASSPVRLRPVATVAKRLSPARSRVNSPKFKGPAVATVNPMPVPTIAEIIAANTTPELFPERFPREVQVPMAAASASPQPAVDRENNIGLAAPTPSQEEILAMMDIMERARTPTAIASAPTAPPAPSVLGPSDIVLQPPGPGAWPVVQAVFDFAESSIREDVRAHRLLYDTFKAESDKGNHDSAHCIMRLIL